MRLRLWMAIPFRELNDAALMQMAQTQPGRLLAYVHAARLTGNDKAAFNAMSILMFSMRPIIRAKVALKVPPHELDEMTSGAITHLTEAAMKKPPKGESITQLRGWMGVVIGNFCSGDYRSGSSDIRRRTLSYDVADDDGAQIWEWGDPDGAYDLIDYWDIIDRRLAGLSDEHEMVVRLKVFGGLPAEMVAEFMNTEYGLRYSANRVDKIASRFKIELKKELDEYWDS